MRILLVEDEKRLSMALAHILKKHNYAVDLAYDGQSGQEMAETGIYDLIILDRMLPQKEGVAILKDLRAQSITTPVLILTAKDAIEDRVEGLDAGADDYLIKPFATQELLARVRALGRRQDNQIQGEILKLGNLALDPLQGLISDSIQATKLTVKESQLLELLMRNRGQVLTKEQILDRVWGFDTEVELNIVEIYIHYLRKKLSSLDLAIRLETVRGIGYCLKEE